MDLLSTFWETAHKISASDSEISPFADTEQIFMHNTWRPSSRASYVWVLRTTSLRCREGNFIVTRDMININVLFTPVP